MPHRFKKITQATIICTVAGFLLAGLLIFPRIKSTQTTERLKNLILVDEHNKVVDTLQFQYKTQLMYDSIAVDQSKMSNQYALLESKQLFFHYNPEFLVWLVIITIMMAIATGIFPQLANRLWVIQSVFKIKRWSIVLISLIVACFGALFTVVLAYNPYLYSYLDWIKQLEILFTKPWVLNIVILIPTLSGLLALAGMLFVSGSAEKLKPVKDSPEVFKENFQLLNKALKFFLTVSTVLITFSVFTSGTLRLAILQEVTVKGVEMIPIEFVYLYGLQFTIVLAIFYFPIYYQLRNKGLAFINSTGEAPGAKDSAKNAENFMQESAMDTFKIAISILAPLLSSILPDMLNF